MKTVKLIKLNLISIRKNIIPIIFQMVFVLLMLTTYYTKYRNSFELIDDFLKSDFKKSIVYYGREDRFLIDILDESQNSKLLKEEKTSFKKIEEIIKETKNIKSVSPNNNVYFFNYNDKLFKGDVLDSGSFSFYKQDLLETIDEDKIPKEYIKLYLVGNENIKKEFKLGDIINSNIRNGYYNPKVVLQDVKLIVSGYINPDAKLLRKNVYVSGEGNFSFLSEGIKSSLNDERVFILENDLLKSKDDVENMTIDSVFTKFIFFDEQTKNDYIEKVNDSIIKSEIGNSNTSEILFKNQNLNVQYLFLKGLDKIVASFIILFSSIVVFSIINSRKIYKQCMIFKLNGARNWQIIMSSFVANIMPVAIVLLSYYFYVEFKDSKYYLFFNNNGYIREDLLIRGNEIVYILFLISLLVFIVNFIVVFPILNSKKLWRK